MLKNKDIKKLVVLQIILVIFGVLLILSVKFDLIEMIPTCVFREKYSYICPTCGVTRCMVNFLTLNFKASFMYHPTFFLIIIYIGMANAIYIVNTIFKKNFLKFLYPSIPILCTFLALHIIQYVSRLCMIVSGIEMNFL